MTCALPAFSHRSCAPRTQRTHMHSVTDFPRFCCSICPGTPGGDRSPSRATRPKAWVLLARWPQGPMQVISVKSDRAARSSNDSIICMSIISIIVIIIRTATGHQATGYHGVEIQTPWLLAPLPPVLAFVSLEQLRKLHLSAPFTPVLALLSQG